MRTPKSLYAQQRTIYQPEILTCPHCGDLLVLRNYLAWKKTVQTLGGVLSVGSRPGRCGHDTCAGAIVRLHSAEAQGIALPGSTYGYDVVVRIGWWRQQYHATYREIHTDLSAHVRISESHVRHLHQQVYLPLLACHERQHRDRLAEVADHHGGLIIALDALPQTPPEELARERQRFAEHRRRFALQSRSRRQTQAQFNQLRKRWAVLPATGTG